MEALSALGTAAGAVSWHVLTGSLRADPFALFADGLIVLLGAGHLAGSLSSSGLADASRPCRGAAEVRTGTAGRRRATARGDAASFLLGLLVLFVALGSGLSRYQASDITVDVAQHVLLMMVAPPLLALGRPAAALGNVVARLGRGGTVAPERAAHLRRLGRVVSGAASWPLYYGSMAAYFLTAAYRVSLDHPALLDVTQVGFVVVGWTFWAGLVGAGGTRAPRSRLFRLAAVAIGMPAETALGLAMVLWPRPLAPGQTLAATHAAGLLLWIACMLTSGVALAVILVQWSVSDSRAAQPGPEAGGVFFEAVSPDGGAGRLRPSPRARPPSRT